MIFQTISVQILTVQYLIFFLHKKKKSIILSLHFLKNAGAYQVIKYYFKLTGENYVSAQNAYSIIQLSN